MQIESVLDKIAGQSPDVLAGIVSHKGQIYHNLKDPYDLLDVQSIIDGLQDAFDLVGTLDEEGLDLGDVIVGFDQHSMVARKLDDGILIVLTRQMRRQQLLKLQVGLGIYARALARALDEAPADAVSPDTVIPKAAEKEPEPAPKKKKVRYYRGVAYYD